MYLKLQQSQPDFSRKGGKHQNCRRDITPQESIEDTIENIFLNANSSKILEEGERNEHEIEEKPYKKKNHRFLEDLAGVAAFMVGIGKSHKH